ncbi:hypothetical protein PMI08_04228 [Brevibacillus sp. CF112]|uniref:Uncharacterized protein n=1 Tax=Brevibacillus fulvus TaxID=1125967 RepID=A0A938Y2I9_9BACL|nr:hypothetical protein PMI08_04228 [Brevibacillus sp. CF112]MBM7591209.1 hypothetical protein [Brevibacillus fulvus]
MNSDILKDEEVMKAIQTLVDKGVTLEMLEKWYGERPI